MRFFNTTGPVVAEDHYHIPPLSRLDLDEVLMLIRQKRYFVLHAPRQTGKTSTLLALADDLNRSGAHRCVYVNVEIGQAAREDVEAAMRAILNELAGEAQHALQDRLLAAMWPEVLERAGPHNCLREVLSRWAEADRTPLVLMIDEIDTLVGGHPAVRAPAIACGLSPTPAPLSAERDPVRYPRRPRLPDSLLVRERGHRRRQRLQRQGPSRCGWVTFHLRRWARCSPSIPRKPVRPWTEAAQGEIWELTQGQPWLVNALAYEACFGNKAGRDRSRPIPADALHDAREQLIARRETHLDQLTDKLQEDRVRRVVEPLLCGVQSAAAIPADDLQYARDLGLVAQDDPIRIANPIYREVIPRDLTWTTQAGFYHDPAWYVDAHGGLLVSELLAAFQGFFREHSEHWVERFQYREAGPQLLLQAFLQRIVNSGGRIEREYGLGRMRTDLLIIWPATAPAGKARRIVIECKLVHRSLEQTIREGIEQTRAYMDRCAAAEGHLVIFDRTEGRSWEDRVFRREQAAGARVTVWGM